MQVEKGLLQKHSVDDTITFSPIKPTTLKLLLALSVQFGLDLTQFDVKTAFVDGD